MNNTEENSRKITGLKVAKYAFTALAGVATLVTSPITTGIAIAAGLGAVISEIALDSEIDKSKLVTVR